MADPRPIAVFDSGIGGLSVLKELSEQLPQEKFIYLADNQYVPYGVMSQESIIERCKTIVEYFIAEDVKAVVLACNTATAASIAELRKSFPVLFFGTEPAIKPAVSLTAKGSIAVLATSATIASEQFSKLLQEFAGDKKILSIAAPNLVSLVEAGHWQSQEAKEEVLSLLSDLDSEFDTLILGCTHFAFLKPLIAELYMGRLTIIDTAVPIARWVKLKMQTDNLLASLPETGKEQNKLKFLVTKESERTRAVFKNLYPDHQLDLLTI